MKGFGFSFASLFREDVLILSTQHAKVFRSNVMT